MRHRSFLVVVLFLLARLCAAGPSSDLPYTQGFDSTAPPSLPPGWSSTQHRSPGQNDFVTTASTARSLPNAVVSTNATIEQALISPLFDFEGFSVDSLSFYTRRSSSHHATLVVEASLDSGRSYTVVLGETPGNTGLSTYVYSALALPDSLNRSQAVRFRWRTIPDASGTAGTLRIDDVSITVKSQIDLALTGMRIVPAPPAGGDSITAIVTVKNVGVRGVQGFVVDLFLDADGDSVLRATERVGSAPAAVGLEPGDSVEIRARMHLLSSGGQLLIGELQCGPDQNPNNNRYYARVTSASSTGRFVINEIQYAPTGGEPEWIELYNATPSAATLKNWSFSDNTVSTRRIIKTVDVFVGPEEYVVLTKDSAALVDAHPAPISPVFTVPGFPSLNNNGDAVVLFDQSGATADSVSYRPSWGGSSGTSLERIDPDSPSTDSTNWAPSEDSSGSTPGKQNSVAALPFDLRVLNASSRFVVVDSLLEIRVIVQNAGKEQNGMFRVLVYDDRNRDSLGTVDELVHSLSVSKLLQYRDSLAVVIQWNRPPPGVHQIISAVDDPRDLRLSNNSWVSAAVVPFQMHTAVINEIMCAPPPGTSEYVEIMNVSGHDIDIDGWKVSDRPVLSGSTNCAVIDLGHRIVHPLELVVVASDSTIFTLFPYLRESALVAVVGRGSMNLNNDGDDIIVKDAGGEAIDSLAYSSAWHNPGVADPTGRSLEKIRPAGSSIDARNWSTCADPLGGTPGRQNSIYAEAVPVSARLSMSPNPFSPDGDGRDDFCVVQYEVPVQVSMVSVRVFDVRGRLIRRLVNNEPSGARGSVVWDGRDDERRKARIGPYIILLEAINERGGILETAKGVVVLAARL